MSGEWIDTKKRMPKERTWVLCLCRAKIYEVLRWQEGVWHKDINHNYFKSFVLYWMPLPPLPKEDHDGKLLE